MDESLAGRDAIAEAEATQAAIEAGFDPTEELITPVAGAPVAPPPTFGQFPGYGVPGQIPGYYPPPQTSYPQPQQYSGEGIDPVTVLPFIPPLPGQTMPGKVPGMAGQQQYLFPGQPDYPIQPGQPGYGSAVLAGGGSGAQVTAPTTTSLGGVFQALDPKPKNNCSRVKKKRRKGCLKKHNAALAAWKKRNPPGLTGLILEE